MVQGLSDAVLTTARTPSAASASVMMRWTRPNLTALPRKATAAGACVDRLEQGEVSEEGIRADRAIGPGQAAGRSRHHHPVPALQVRYGARRDVANAALESGVPLLACPGLLQRVERKRDVGAGLAGTLSHDHVADGRGLAPVDVAGVLADAHQLEARGNPHRGLDPRRDRHRRTPGGRRRELDGVHGGIDDELPLSRNFAGLFEQAEGKARRDAEPNVDDRGRVASACAGTRRPAPTSG